MAQFPSIVRQLRSMVSASGSTGMTDAELLDRFVTMRDEPAFEVLIWRHGPMVLGLCRRLLGQEQDCEDAFQATFLALARKAGSITRREAIASWLYKVAYRIALDARMQRGRITTHEIGVAACPDTPGPDDVAGAVAGQELKSLLDGAIQRLARKYREPVVLCYLEGKTQEEAAAELGWAKGTVSTRLIRARRMLRRRLQGLVETPTFPGMLPALASSPVPRAWVQESLRMALGFRARSIAGHAASTKAMMLAEGVLHAMALSRWKIAAMLLVLVGLTGGAGWMGYQMAFAAAPAEEVAQKPAGAPGNDESGEKRATSPLNQLDPQRIPTEDRFPWQPPELVAVLGEHRGHVWGRVACAAFSPDGRLIASSGFSPAIHLWDAATLRERAILPQHTQEVSCLAFSPDGKTLASAGSDRTLVLWDMTTTPPRPWSVLPCPERVAGLAFSPDGALLARTGAKGEIALFTVVGTKTPEPFCLLHGPDDFLRGLAFFPDGKTLAAGTHGGSVFLWDVPTKTLRATLKGEVTHLWPLAVSPDGKMLAYAGDDRQGRLGFGGPLDPDAREPRNLVVVWDVIDRDHPKKKSVISKHSGQVSAIKFSPDGKTLASASGEKIVCLWDVTGLAPVERVVIQTHSSSTALDFSPDGRTLLAGGTNGLLGMWDLTAAGPKERFEPKGHTDGWIYGLSLSRTGMLASEANDGVRLWDLSGTQPGGGSHVFPWGEPGLSSDGKTLAIGAPQGTIEVWDLQGAEPKKRWSRQAHKLEYVSGINLIRISPNGKTLISCGTDDKIQSWDLTTDEPREQTLLQGQGPTCALHFSRSGALVSLASYGQSLSGGGNPGLHRDSAAIRVWDMTGSKPREMAALVHRPDVSTVAFSPDGKILATAAGSRILNEGMQPGEIRLWKLGIPGRKEPYVILDGLPTAVNSLVFSPDGQILASAGWQGQVTLWEPATGKKYREWQLPGSVNRLAFSEDGRHLITANTNSTIYVLRLGHGIPAATDPKPLWETLASNDGAAVYQAIWGLTGAAPQALALFRDRLHQVPPLAAEQVAQWIKQLDDSRFSERQKATKALEQLRERAEPALLRTLAEGHPSLEARQRMEEILQKIPQPGLEQMRTLRAIQVLDHIGTSEARRLLKELAQGAAEAVETQYARAAVERMEDSR